jgi:hypothetical protein
VADEQKRYGRNRHKWRKIYSYGANFQPKVVTFIDSRTAVPLQYDLNKIYRHYDYHIIRPNFEYDIYDVYEEGIIHFNNESQKSYTFSKIWEFGPPYVVYTVLSGYNDNENVNVFGYDYPTVSGGIAATSAPFSGTVLYRAISAPFYPILTFNSTSSFFIFAGAIDITNQTHYTASYTMPGTIIDSNYLATAHEFTGLFDNDVYLEKENLSSTQCISTLSAPINNRIHFHVIQPNT